jgi:hypothetical protein
MAAPPWRDPRTPDELAARRRELELAALRSAIEILEAAPVTMKDRGAALARARRALVFAVHGRH